MLSIEGLRSVLSAERLSAYALPEDADEVDTVASYLWNLALCSALQPALHTLEITVRNRLFNISRRIVDETRLSFDKIPCWLDARPPLLADRERQAVSRPVRGSVEGISLDPIRPAAKNPKQDPRALVTGSRV